MKQINIAALMLVSSQAVQIKSGAAPDVYGPNGLNYRSIDAKKDLSNIGMDIHE
jgi:hypothetical protein